MRSIRVTLTTELDATNTLETSTEVLLDDTADAHDAGAQTWRELIAFRQGMTDEAEASS